MTRHRRLARTHGAGLIVALVVLIVMALGALALLRSVTTGLLIAGNFAFREAAVLAAESGSEAAIEWLSERATDAELLADQADAGYYASLPMGMNLTGQADADTTA